ncbi:hypothetical protein [Noviherbaspirillum suwonense]|jgi:hypothetical protein|uniref:hypothetical protein n=1 Tax=Noviherbaspirillum suwonense TaxID=1224511 RepID=UPI0024B80A83|nr:hypothetical protein [Noviherbaspirillum suwonense]
MLRMLAKNTLVVRFFWLKRVALHRFCEQFVLTNNASRSTLSFPRNSGSFDVFRRAPHDDAAVEDALHLKAVCSNPRQKREKPAQEPRTSG